MPICLGTGAILKEKKLAKAESVAVMPQSILSARSARGRGCCGRWKKYTTSCRRQKK
jgi:hypothetical protein